MPVNMGTLDREVCAGSCWDWHWSHLRYRTAGRSKGWHWTGLIGLVLLATAFFRSCPLYTVLGVSSRSVRE